MQSFIYAVTAILRVTRMLRPSEVYRTYRIVVMVTLTNSGGMHTTEQRIPGSDPW